VRDAAVRHHQAIREEECPRRTIEKADRKLADPVDNGILAMHIEPVRKIRR
jgi:hypothetical protein